MQTICNSGQGMSIFLIYNILQQGNCITMTCEPQAEMGEGPFPRAF